MKRYPSDAKAPAPAVTNSRAYSPTFQFDITPTSPQQMVPPVGPGGDGAAETQDFPLTLNHSNNVPQPDNYSPPTKGGTLREMQKG